MKKYAGKTDIPEIYIVVRAEDKKTGTITIRERARQARCRITTFYEQQENGTFKKI